MKFRNIVCFIVCFCFVNASFLYAEDGGSGQVSTPQELVSLTQEAAEKALQNA